jgi:formyl-CoA transferase
MHGPLEGITVVDLSRALAGPHAAMMLGDLGARVVKVESPGTGDDTRGWGPPFVGPENDRQSTYFLSCNRNKESIVLDLKSDDGRTTLARLIRGSDVLVENFRPGVLDRLGFPADRLRELNSRLVVLSISGFGHDGPQGGRAGYDQIAQGEAGLMSLTGPSEDEPTRIGVPIGDLLAGMYGAFGVVSALHERAQSGRGGVVRTSLLAAIVGVHAFQGTRYTVAGEVPHAQGNHHPSLAPYGSFRCRDAIVQVAVGSEGLWRAFAPLVNIDPADTLFANNASRVQHRQALIELVNDAFADRDVVGLLADLDKSGIPAGEVRTLDRVYEWDQTRSQGLVIEVDHPVLGKINLPGPPLRFDAHPGVAGHQPPPTLGQHNESVRSWLDELEQSSSASR